MLTSQTLQLTTPKYKMLCSEQLIAKLCPVFYSVWLAHETNTCFPFFPAVYKNFRHVISMKNDNLPLSKMANTKTNACYKILCAGYSLPVARKCLFKMHNNQRIFLYKHRTKWVFFTLPEWHVQGGHPRKWYSALTVHWARCISAPKRTLSVHQSAMLLVFQCISAPNTNNKCTWCTLKYC